MFELVDSIPKNAEIKVVGVGGGGGNTLNRVAGFDKGVAFAHVKSGPVGKGGAAGLPPRGDGP